MSVARVTGLKAARRTVGWAATTMALLLWASNVDAGPLGLTVRHPDLTAPLALSYNASTQTLSAHEADSILNLIDAGGISTPFFGTFSLSASINNSGLLGPGGSLRIFGDLGGGLTTLLEGTLTAFGFDRPAFGLGTFEFLFNVTSTTIPGFNTLGGITIGSKIDVPSWDFFGDFATKAGNEAQSDTFAVPEPALLSLLLLGGAAVVRRRFSRA